LLEALDEDLRVIAELRLECPWDSLRDLGDLTLPKVSKSTVAYRMKKIIAYYHQLCPQKKKG
jgi:DNA-binding transcriptional regulator WhiA